jgi:hypothetical protein
MYQKLEDIYTRTNDNGTEAKYIYIMHIYMDGIDFLSILAQMR